MHETFTRGKQWVYGSWPTSWLGENITLLELSPIVLTVFLWGNKMKNHKIWLYIDNLALVEVLNKQQSKEKKVMILMRKLVLKCMQYNILFNSKHISGVKNDLADSLSRLQINRFQQLTKQQGLVINRHPTKSSSRVSPRKLANTTFGKFASNVTCPSYSRSLQTHVEGIQAI